MPRGKFISFEGGEGSGKSTQINYLHETLKSVGIDVIKTREPGGSDGAEEIRNLLVDGNPERWDAVTETLLHCAARRDHLKTTVVPALQAGQWVLTDRFSDSTMAYQGYGHGVNKKALKKLHQFIAGNIEPDITIILDLPIKVGLARAEERAGKQNTFINKVEDRYERMDKDFHERLRKGFINIAKNNRKRCIVIDTTRSIDEIKTTIRRLVFEKLGLSNDG